MKGDFSRDSFDASRSVYRVLMQQGRVQLDADWNEQAAAVLHRLETTVRDMFGSCAGPADHCGFALFSPSDGDADADFAIGAGRYYVDGLLVENFRPQPFGVRLERGHPYLIYLDVWEEFISAPQDPALTDPALDGLDTTARTRVEWRVRAQRVGELPSREELAQDWPYGYLASALLDARGRLAASVDVQIGAFDPSFDGLTGGYQGSENRLYRVEIHQPGSAAEGATFKWSRDNGSVVFAIRSVTGNVVTLDGFGRDGVARLTPGDWVEIEDDDDAGREAPARGLFVVAETDPAGQTIALKTAPGYVHDSAKHPVLRRWDQGTAPLRVIEGADVGESWIQLEDGLAIRFAPRTAGDGDAMYHSGDYWMIPARTPAGGSLLWPLEADGRPALREPAGVQHHFAPLAGVYIAASGKMIIDRKRHDYRNRFSPLATRL
jgi:hypothetical protein